MTDWSDWEWQDGPTYEQLVDWADAERKRRKEQGWVRGHARSDEQGDPDATERD